MAPTNGTATGVTVEQEATSAGMLRRPHPPLSLALARRVQLHLAATEIIQSTIVRVELSDGILFRQPPTKYITGTAMAVTVLKVRFAGILRRLHLPLLLAPARRVQLHLAAVAVTQSTVVRREPSVQTLRRPTEIITGIATGATAVPEVICAGMLPLLMHRLRPSVLRPLRFLLATNRLSPGAHPMLLAVAQEVLGLTRVRSQEAD